MKNRRQFLQISAAVMAIPSLLATASPSLLSTPKLQPIKSQLYKVVFDNRFSDSSTFAKEAKRLGATISGIDGDVTDLWYKDLYYQWEKKPAAIAGLTTATSLFCLEQLARNHKMRVVFRADHKTLANGSVEHQLSGPESLLQQEVNQTYVSSDWPYRMAALVSDYPTIQSPQMRTTIVSRASHPQPQSASKIESLVSWVIAPQ